MSDLIYDQSCKDCSNCDNVCSSGTHDDSTNGSTEEIIQLEEEDYDDMFKQELDDINDRYGRWV